MNGHPGTRVTVEETVSTETANGLYALYTTAFAHLEESAAARHLLHEQEFLEEVGDPRVLKYVAWDGDDSPIGLCTVTNSLDAVPWISPAFYAAQYPEHHARDAIHYIGVMMVHPSRQGAGAFQQIVEQIMMSAVRVRAVLAWDLCEHNRSAGLQRLFAGKLARMSEASVIEIDRQTYYGAVVQGPPRDGVSGEQVSWVEESDR